MNLREEICRSIEKLDNDALACVYEEVRLLLQVRKIHDKTASVPALENVLLLTSVSTDSWSDNLCAGRDDRI